METLQVLAKQLSPHKPHPILEGTDTMNGSQRKPFFLDICSTHQSDITKQNWFLRNLLLFFKILFTKKNYYFDGFEGCLLPMLLFLYFQIPQARAFSEAHFQK